jgi:pyruvate kinase
MKMQMQNRKTKILSTIGPACSDVKTLEKMIVAGVNVFRMNFSHGTHESHLEMIGKIREASRKADKLVGILQDICGPKVRIGTINGEFLLKEGDYLFFHKDKIDGYKDDKGYHTCINQPQILPKLKVGESIYLCDGKIHTLIESTNDIIKVRVENDGILSSNKGVNFPNTKIDIEVLTEKDKKDMEWGIKNDVDFMAISFVQNAKDMEKAKSIIAKHNGDIQLFAKIEKFDALENIDEIIEVSDGIMVARGDLGIEIPYYKVPLAQKEIIEKANEYSKPVITATQMLLSMVDSPIATRAEISDVSNAVLDGTDCVMLSEETAIGKYPVETIETMSNTILETEKKYPYYKLYNRTYYNEVDVIASSACKITNRVSADAIFALTTSGFSARQISRYRPKKIIFAVTSSKKVGRSLTICWGIKSIFSLEHKDFEQVMSDLINVSISKGVMDKSKKYILSYGYPFGEAFHTNTLKILNSTVIDYFHK